MKNFLKKNKILIIVTARKNSKRLHNKNIKKLKKKKLIDYTFEFIKKNFRDYPVYISTDSNLIKKQALKYKFICPNLRPKKISKDNTTSEEVIRYVIKWYEKKICKIDTVILFQPTSPFRRIQDIKKALSFFFKKNFRKISIISCKKEIQKNFYKMNKKKNIVLLRKKFLTPNGSFYIIGRDKIMYKKKIYGEETYSYLIKSKKYNIDIDDYYDFKQAEKFCN